MSDPADVRMESAQEHQHDLREIIEWEEQDADGITEGMLSAIRARDKALILACCAVMCLDCKQGVPVKRYEVTGAARAQWVHGDIACRASGIREDMREFLEAK